MSSIGSPVDQTGDLVAVEQEVGWTRIAMHEHGPLHFSRRVVTQPDEPEVAEGLAHADLAVVDLLPGIDLEKRMIFGPARNWVVR
jgi:hypothetical protein